MKPAARPLEDDASNGGASATTSPRTRSSAPTNADAIAYETKMLRTPTGERQANGGVAADPPVQTPARKESRGPYLSMALGVTPQTAIINEGRSVASASASE